MDKNSGQRVKHQFVLDPNLRRVNCSKEEGKDYATIGVYQSLLKILNDSVFVN